MAKRLRFLHLSDLHVGEKAAADQLRIEPAMGDAWAAILREIAADGAIDLTCFTGDLAQRGTPEDVGVRDVIDAVLQLVGCPRDVFLHSSNDAQLNHLSGEVIDLLQCTCHDWSLALPDRWFSLRSRAPGSYHRASAEG